jgi:glycosyltransferase involved in cell wall biosynthesis
MNKTNGTVRRNGNGNGNGKPKIALLHFSGPPIISGVELIMRDQARLFRQFNYKVEIIVGVGEEFRKDIPIHILKRMNSTHPQVLKVRKELAKKTVSKTFKFLKNCLYQDLKKHILTNNITICIVHNVMTRHYNLPLTEALVKLSRDLPQVNFISWVHDATFADTSYFKIDPKLSASYPWSLLVTPLENWTYVCISEFRKKELIKTFSGIVPKRLTVIPNGIDVAKFLRLSPQIREFYKTTGGLESDLIACTPVRLVRRKNLELGIKIASAMVKRGINYKYIITGNLDQHQENQSYYQSLKKLIEELDLGQNVFLLAEFLSSLENGNKNRQVGIEEIYMISDFLLMTSSIEGFGLPLIEAGLSRTPIFTSDIKPFHEIGTTNINYFSLSANPDKIANVILDRMKELPQAYFYRKVIKKYSILVIFTKKIIPLITAIARIK